MLSKYPNNEVKLSGQIKTMQLDRYPCVFDHNNIENSLLRVYKKDKGGEFLVLL